MLAPIVYKENVNRIVPTILIVGGSNIRSQFGAIESLKKGKLKYDSLAPFWLFKSFVISTI